MCGAMNEDAPGADASGCGGGPGGKAVLGPGPEMAAEPGRGTGAGIAAGTGSEPGVAPGAGGMGKLGTPPAQCGWGGAPAVGIVGGTVG